MKKLLFFLIIIFSVNSYSQEYDKKEFKRTFQDAEYFFLFEDYNKALPLYLKLYKLDSTNANVNYRIGICYTEDKLNAHHAVEYLERATNNISSKYKVSSYKEKGSHYECYKYLGRALQRDFEFDKAIIAFTIYENLVPVDNIQEVEITKKEIESCKNAKELLVQSALNYVKVDILSDKINTKYPEYTPISSEDENTLVFTSRRRYKIRDIDELEYIDEVPDEFYMEDIYFSTFENNAWKPAEKITKQLKADEYTSVVSLSRDGKKLFLLRKDILTAREDEGNIYMSELIDGKWSSMKKLNSNINTDKWETHASLSEDETKLYFSSARDGGFGGLDIYVSNINEKGDWGPAENLGNEINSIFDEEYPFILANNKTLYFSSQGHYNIGGHDIFYSTLTDNNEWSSVINLGYPINTMDNDIFFCPINNGKEAYISLETHEGFGSTDIYKFYISQSTFGDFGSQEFLSTKTDTLVFPTNLASLYRVNERIESSSIKRVIKYEEPTNKIIPVATALKANNVIIKGQIILSDGKQIDSTFIIDIIDPNILKTRQQLKPKLETAKYYFKSKLNIIVVEVRGNGYKLVIQNIKIPDNYDKKEMTVNITMHPLNADELIVQKNNPIIEPTIEKPIKTPLTIKGNIILSDNNLVDSTFVILIKDPSLANKNKLIKPTIEKGNYLFKTKSHSINIEVNGNGYQTATKSIIVPNDYAMEEMVVNINMKPIEVASGEYYTIKSIFFDYGKHNLKRESKIELEKLYSLMSKNPSLYIEVAGFTDSRSSVSFNKKLSKKRAKSAINYLVAKSIKAERFVAKGMGENSPLAINNNPDGTDNPEGRQLNRRVDIKLLNTDITNAIVEPVLIPNKLKYSGSSRNNKKELYILLSIQPNKFTKTVKFKYDELKTINDYVYSMGAFYDKTKALKSLNNAVKSGFNDAKIINKKEYIRLTNVVKPITNYAGDNIKGSFAIQIKALSKPVKISNFTKLKNVKEYLGADGFYRYTYRNFTTKGEARKAMNEVAKEGFLDAFIIDISKYKKREETGKAEYTIQLKALKKPINVKFFSNLKGVMEFIANDGYYKYTIGTYSTMEKARERLVLIKAKGYKDAFIVNVEKYF